jgi:CheY-like chemotaxis protein
MPVELLVVEDNSSEARLVEEIVRSSSVQVNVRTAKNCSGAIAILDGGRFVPNLVIADMSLLEYGGVELLKRCNPRDIPVVVFSGSINPADQERAIRLGAKEFVSKPFRLDDYVKAVWAMIDKWTKLGSVSAGNTD